MATSNSTASASQIQSSISSTPFVAAEHMNDGKRHLLLAASGSVATIKLPNIAQALSRHPNLSIRILVTQSAEKFLIGQSAEQPHLESLQSIPNVDGIYRDEDEWTSPWTRGGGILHIELRRWADMLVIAPLSANTLAKVVVGLADNLLTSVVRAWDTTGLIDPVCGKKRIIVAPAMNTAMWRHPITKQQIRVLEEDWGVDGGQDGWYEVLRPMEKELACGDIGDGAMKDWREIVDIIEQRLNLSTSAPAS
ncbi:phosphopantothenoylcysteine decarboxylase [Xylona heveae TC161]|uniref:Phosphopantothenoylcysteine decarboxylase n=1 Tax=Xylona heveae (strain CBS 132557 / TC161) TaxID=1328760 RepID=A0A165J2U0_XYLHT|nr:phosphopantothenoylcysteine decarboxylase [Xylona heveae TC161]KZF25652.1 phosphopantothenoylcysteine decarboxylase [Xylona heveae TC161]